MQLLGDYRVFWVDCLDDRRGEEGETLDSDVVYQIMLAFDMVVGCSREGRTEEENEGRGQRDWTQNAAQRLRLVDPVKNFGGTDTLRLDPRMCKILLFLRQPPCRLGAIRQREESNQRETARNDALDGKDHAPLVKTPKTVKLQDGTREQAAESSSERRHDDVQTQSEGKLASAIPTGHVVGNARQHAGLENAQQEAYATDGCLCVYKSGAKRADTESQGDEGDEPPGTHPLAGHVAGDFEDDVADVEDGKHDVVIIALHSKVFFQTGDFCVSNVGSVDEAEQVQEGDCGHDVEIDFPS